MNFNELKDLLDESYERNNNPVFITEDPIIVPHSFSHKEDIEIAGFFSATLAWGQRPQIIRSSMHLMQMMDQEPYKFITSASENEVKMLERFVHRTFNGSDCIFFVRSLKNIYIKHNGLESVFSDAFHRYNDLKQSLIEFRKLFFEIPHLHHAEKHISDAAKESACKRLNLFLRWMVRNDGRGVDFGLWKKIPS